MKIGDKIGSQMENILRKSIGLLNSQLETLNLNRFRKLKVEIRCFCRMVWAASRSQVAIASVRVA